MCPLCNIPIAVKKGVQPDLVVGMHIDNDCQSDPAKSKRKVSLLIIITNMAKSFDTHNLNINFIISCVIF